MSGKKIILIMVIITFIVSISGKAKADMTLDLTTAGASGFIDEAFFIQVPDQSTGTGVIDPFLRVQANGTEQGYNTDFRYQPGNKTEFDEVTNHTYTHSLELSTIPTVNIGGTDYLQFLLDINQNKGSDHELLSLDQIEIYQTNDQYLHDYITTKATVWDPLLVYSMDTSLSNNWIKLNFELNPGSGAGDMFAYIPSDYFNTGKYVYLYSYFGLNFGSNDGIEEWAVIGEGTPVIPAPGAILLGMLGLGFSGLKLRRFA